jgi:hypothetical protein
MSTSCRRPRPASARLPAVWCVIDHHDRARFGRRPRRGSPRPNCRASIFPHRFVRGVLHHLVEDRDRVDRPIVHRSDTVEEALRPYQHSLAALFRQSDRVRHDRDGNMLRQLGNGVEGSSSTKRSTTASACALIASRCGWRAFGVRGRTSTLRSASCSAPSLHNVLPRSTWFHLVVQHDAKAGGNDSQSSRARRTEAYRVSANISYSEARQPGPASRSSR